MEEEVPFEAQQVLQELYSLDAVVQGIQAGNWERYKHLLCVYKCQLNVCYMSSWCTTWLDIGPDTNMDPTNKPSYFHETSYI